MAGSDDHTQFRFSDNPLFENALSSTTGHVRPRPAPNSTGNMSAEISSPIVEPVWVTSQPVQANMANLSFGNTLTLDGHGGSFGAIMNSEQHLSTAPVTANTWAAPPPTGSLGHHPAFNIAAGTRAIGAYAPILLQGRTPYGNGESFQAIMNSEQHSSAAPVTANIWADPLSADTMGHHPGFNPVAGTQALAAYDSMSPAYMPAPSVFPGSFQQLPKEIQAHQIESMLISLRQSGVQFAEISNMIKTRFGVERSVNALVKQFGKLQNLYLGPLPEAVKNVMPDLVTAVEDEIARMDLSMLTEADKTAMEEILKELPQMIPRFVQNRVMRKRKCMDK